jgi:hypothetical protein
VLPLQDLPIRLFSFNLSFFPGYALYEAVSHPMLNYKIKTSILIFYLCASLINSIVFLGENSLVSFFVGELIVTLFAFDLAKTEYKLHIYQVLLCYFYYSLCLTHSFSGFYLESDYYTWSYAVSLTHFIFFAIGYNSIEYKSGTLTFYPKQNIIALLFLLVPVVLAVVALKFEGSGKGYRDMFLVTAQEARGRLNIVTYVYEYILGTLQMIVLFIFSNPIVYGVCQFMSGLVAYIGNGIKASIFATSLSLLMIYQIYFKRIKVNHFLLLLPLGFVFVALLIGSTAFRGDLSIKSMMSIDGDKIYASLNYFLTGPESSHIIYTANLLEMIDKGDTTYRFGFDFYRIFLYPFRGFVDNFKYASYVEFAAILNGTLSNAGQYIGLAGELYWNCGIFFFVFSFLMGLALKYFTNYAFSLNPFGIISYLVLFKHVTWVYYRGAVSDLTMRGVLYFMTALVFFGLMKIFAVKFPRFGRKLVKENGRPPEN